jgi:hypothetical protein
MSYVFRRLLSVWVVMGAAVLTLTIEFCYFMEALAIGSDVVLSWGATPRSMGLLFGGGIIAFALVTAATIIILHIPSPIVRFVGGALYACAALVVQLCNDSATAAAVTAIRHVRGDWDADSVGLGVTVVCAVVCFVLLGANVSRLKVSRHSLDDLLHAMKREMNRMQSDLAVQMEIATDERKERAVVRIYAPALSLPVTALLRWSCLMLCSVSSALCPARLCHAEHCAVGPLGGDDADVPAAHDHERNGDGHGPGRWMVVAPDSGGHSGGSGRSAGRCRSGRRCARSYNAQRHHSQRGDAQQFGGQRAEGQWQPRCWPSAAGIHRACRCGQSVRREGTGHVVDSARAVG